MRHAVLFWLLAVGLGIASSPAHAWWDEGHMQIAYVAYKRLSSVVCGDGCRRILISGSSRLNKIRTQNFPLGLFPLLGLPF